MHISQIDQSTQGDHTINKVKIADFIWHDLVKNCAAGICRLQIDVGTVFWKIVKNFFKAELLQVGIFFLIHLFAWEILLLKKLEIEETKTT